ncbi:MAG: hypothetical protein ABEL51_06985 [Salinibacter sp.]
MTALFRSAFVFALLSWTVGPSAAQPTPPVDTVDLVLVGQHLEAPTHTIAVKTNPWRSNRWTSVRKRGTSGACPSQPRLHVIPGLSAARFLGQDIRENYIALKITATEDADGTLRAAYALPSTLPLDRAACERLALLIATDPATVRRHSVASHVRPRPARLSADAPLIEHLEAPIRHRKPGVMEVEWLEILFRPEQ